MHGTLFSSRSLTLGLIVTVLGPNAAVSLIRNTSVSIGPTYVEPVSLADSQVALVPTSKPDMPALVQVEIIQIGAVAVTDGIVSEDFFSEYVRPRYYTELKGRIKKLTGITKNDLKNAHDLTVVLKSFREWLEKFGKDVIIVTWGPDDIPTLVKQCEFYERDTGWLPEWFNLQPLMTRQYGIDRAQITLQSAVEITGVQQELDYHSAINDAYYTALVLTKINDIPSEIELQKKIDYVHSNPFLSLRQTSEGTVKTARMNAVPRLSELNRYICPVCGKPATLKSRLIWLSPMNYMAVVHCNKHSVKVTVRFEKKADGEYRWVKKYTLSEEKDEELYSSLLKEKYPALQEKSDRKIPAVKTGRNRIKVKMERKNINNG